MKIKNRFLVLAITMAGTLIMTDCKKDKDALPFFFLLGGGEEAVAGETTEGQTESGTEFTVNNGDVIGESEFEFQTTETIDIEVTVTDDDGPVEGAGVTVKDSDSDDTLYQGVTDENGKATGTVEVTPDTGNVTVTVEAGDDVIEQEVATNNLQEINRGVDFEGTVDTGVIADADADGIADEDDAYPEDETRATRLLVPSADGQVVAYEDLYPSPGDADFNDYVIKVQNELDLDASGKVVRIRGTYQHIARGAGYKHTLHLTLPGTGKVTRKLFSSNGDLESESENTGSLTGIEVMPQSNTTISQSNTAPGQSFKAGKYAELEIVLDTPVARSDLGRAPFDLYIKVINTNKEVHFPGMYYAEDGSDRYMDANGFPWALSVPKQWNWPYERENIADGYPDFQTWYLSMGQDKSDWYKRSVDSEVFPYVTEGALAAYIRAGFRNGSILWSLLALGIAGLFALFFYRERSYKQEG